VGCGDAPLILLASAFDQSTPLAVKIRIANVTKLEILRAVARMGTELILGSELGLMIPFPNEMFSVDCYVLVSRLVRPRIASARTNAVPLNAKVSAREFSPLSKSKGLEIVTGT
jgi:hypothetical protein